MGNSQDFRFLTFNGYVSQNSRTATAGTLGVATLSYLPWAILCWSGIIFAIIYGASGIGIAKLKK